jgi:hypothetical protein
VAFQPPYFSYNVLASCIYDAIRRFKGGKEHCYWNIIESKRGADGITVPICSGDFLAAQSNLCASQPAYPLQLRKLG